jgi:hypothetical protein
MSLTREQILSVLEVVEGTGTFMRTDVVAFARRLKSEHALGNYAFKMIALLPKPEQLRVLGAVQEFERQNGEERGHARG